MINLSQEEIDAMPDYMPVVGFEGHYEVGKDGSLWSLNYKRSGQRKQMRPAPDKDGYLHVLLCKDGEQKTCRVHQLVLNAYYPKPSDDLEVLHQNSEPSDNRLENLAWGTHDENLNDPHYKALKFTPVLCAETGGQYPSVHEASRQTDVDQSSISACLNGRRKTAGGFHWRKVLE